jgi:hypothetical protein
MPSYTEEDVTNASNALANGEIKSIRRAALVFQIPFSTLRYRLQNRKTKLESHVSQQLLTPIEESTLDNWIYRAAKLGTPITLQLVKILASEIQLERSSKNNETELSPTGTLYISSFFLLSSSFSF